MPYIINPEKGYVVSANNNIVENNYKYRLNGGFMIDTRSKAIENAIEFYIKNNIKITEEIVMSKLLNIIKDPFCDEILRSVFNILEKEEKYAKSLNTDSILKKFSLLKNSDFNCEMKGESKEALIFNTFEQFYADNLYYNIDVYDTEEKKNAKKNIMYNMVRENYLLYKIRLYEKDPETCLKDYKTSCFNFLNVIIEKTFEFLKVNFSENENFWKWKNISKKTFPNKPFSMIPGFNVLAHRVISTDGNSRTPKVSYSRIDGNHDGNVSSNLKLLITPEYNKMKTYMSIDVGQNGKLFHRHYDDFINTHEKADLFLVDTENIKGEFTLEFRKKK